MIGSGALAQERDRADRLLSKLKNYKAESEEVVHQTIAATVTLGGSYAGAYIDARYPDKNLAGVPLSLAGGAAFGFAGVFGVGGDSDYILSALGIGLGCATAAKEGAKKGAADLAASQKKAA